MDDTATDKKTKMATHKTKTLGSFPHNSRLLFRSLSAPLRIGHPFFWLLRAEMHVHNTNLRYGLLLKCFLQVTYTNVGNGRS